MASLTDNIISHENIFRGSKLAHPLVLPVASFKDASVLHCCKSLIVSASALSLLHTAIFSLH